MARKKKTTKTPTKTLDTAVKVEDQPKVEEQPKEEEFIERLGVPSTNTAAK